MTVSLYDLSVGSYLQTVSGVMTVLEKGASFASDRGLDVNTLVAAGLHNDMLPLLFQINCIPLHSLGALEAMETGLFTPPKTNEPRDYAALQALVAETKATLESLSAEDINAHSGKTVVFKFGDYEMPFTAENFVMSFSLPNLNFHATTAYDILRHNGVPLGKADYLGQMRIGV